MTRAARLLSLLLLVCLLAACGRTHQAPVYDRNSWDRSGGTRTVYVVQRGDTLYSIAFRHGLNYRDLARWNHIDAGYTIYPGQKLRLTAPPRQASTSSRSTASPPRTKTDSVKQSAGNSTPDRTLTGNWQWPTAGTLARSFSANDAGKKGIEIKGKLDQPIVAAEQGTVVYSGNGLRGYGNLIIIKHNNRYLTAYGYNKELLVKEGQSVKAGELIARMGMAPERYAALHFELRVDGKAVDPVRFLKKRQ